MRGLPPRRTPRGFYTPEGELVWTGISDTFNPISAKKAINNVVKVVVRDLEKVGKDLLKAAVSRFEPRPQRHRWGDRGELGVPLLKPLLYRFNVRLQVITGSRIRLKHT